MNKYRVIKGYKDYYNLQCQSDSTWYSIDAYSNREEAISAGKALSDSDKALAEWRSKPPIVEWESQ